MSVVSNPKSVNLHCLSIPSPPLLLYTFYIFKHIFRPILSIPQSPVSVHFKLRKFTMRFVLLLLPLLAAVVAAQQNAINVPSGGLQIVANDPVTITWSDPSEGTVTIKLQQAPNITPDTGLVLACA